MLYSKSAKQNGGSGFFFVGDKNAPADALQVADADVKIAINLPNGATFDFQPDGALLVTPAPIPSAAESKAIKAAEMWERIKSERERLKASGYQVGAKWFHSDADSRIQQLGLKDSARDALASGGTMASPIKIDGADVPWKTMSGEFVIITAQLAFDIVDTAKKFDKQVFTVAEQHRAAMEASADPAAYDYSTGWPAVFVG